MSEILNTTTNSTEPTEEEPISEQIPEPKTPQEIYAKLEEMETGILEEMAAIPKERQNIGDEGYYTLYNKARKIQRKLALLNKEMQTENMEAMKPKAIIEVNATKEDTPDQPSNLIDKVLNERDKYMKDIKNMTTPALEQMLQEFREEEKRIAAEIKETPIESILNNDFNQNQGKDYTEFHKIVEQIEAELEKRKNTQHNLNTSTGSADE